MAATGRTRLRMACHQPDQVEGVLLLCRSRGGSRGDRCGRVRPVLLRRGGTVGALCAVRARPGRTATGCRRAVRAFAGDLLGQVHGELVYQLAADLDHHAPAELGRAAGHVHRRVHGDHGAAPRRIGLEGGPDGRRGGAGAAGLLAGGLHHHDARVGVALGEGRGAAVGQRDRPHLDLEVPVDHVAVDLVDGRARHARRDPLHVKQDAPGLLRRDGHGKRVVELHGHGYVTLSVLAVVLFALLVCSVSGLCPVSDRIGKDLPRGRDR